MRPIPFSFLLGLPLVAAGLVYLSPLAPAQDASPAPDAEAGGEDVTAAPENIIAGTVAAVTVYRGQALITRRLAPPKLNDDGTAEIVVTDLPGNVVPGSLYAESSAPGIEVRSVRFRTRPVNEDVREEVRTLDEQMQELGRQIQRTQKLQGVLQEKNKFLDNLESFTADTSERELKQGVLDAEQLKTLTEYLFTQEETIALREVELHEQLADLQQGMQLLQRKRQTISGGSSRTVREAVVFLGKGAAPSPDEAPDPKEAAGVNPPAPAPAAASISVRYLVNGASWSPSYNLRSDEVNAGNVTLEYYASVQQTSGEDWTNVAMTLSTATPSLIAAPPGLEPLIVALQQEEMTEITLKVRAEGYLQVRRQLQDQVDVQTALRNSNANAPAQFAAKDQRLDEAGAIDGLTDRSSRVKATDSPGDAGQSLARNFDDQMNRWSKQIQVLDLVAGRETRDFPGRPKPERSDAAEGVSVTYELPGQISLPSRSDRQLVQIAQLSLPADSYNRATPVLGPYIYNAAEVSNTGKMVLLAGPTQAFKNGEFVGHGSIPTVAAGESFTVGFGIDASLRADRELVKREEKTQGGNVVSVFTYRITLENFGDDAAPVRVLDRLPHPTRDVAGEGLRVDLTSASPAVSDDEEYQAFARELGILRWDVEVPPSATGGKAMPITFTFNVEHDKQKTLTLPEAVNAPDADAPGGGGGKKSDMEDSLKDVTF